MPAVYVRGMFHLGQEVIVSKALDRLRGANLAKHLCGKEQKITSYDCDESEGL